MIDIQRENNVYYQNNPMYFNELCNIVEIKGDHFFVESGQMICPFRKKKWSDERYADECAKYEAKHQYMLKNNVKIMRSDEYLFLYNIFRRSAGKISLKILEAASEFK